MTSPLDSESRRLIADLESPTFLALERELTRGEQAECATPTRIGRFEIQDEVGRGGYGIVFRAFDPTLGRDVALKVLWPELQFSADARRRFVNESRAAARLDHPNIVPVYETGQFGPVCYIVFAYCPGATLSRWLAEQGDAVPPSQAARLVLALADAVEHAHRRGIWHRDLKPDNVLLDVDGGGVPSPRITDFGLARLAEAESLAETTRSGAPVGTPAYMAPEQAAGRSRDIGPATDVYGLGAILYTILTGRPPHKGETGPETIQRVLNEPPPAPRLLRPGLPRDLEAICLKCLEKEPTWRYASARELADELRPFLDGELVQARHAMCWRRAHRWVRRHPFRTSVAGGGPLLVAALIGVLSWLGDSSRQLEQARAEAVRSARLAARHHLADAIRRASQALGARRVELAQEIIDTVRPEPDGFDPRGFAWRWLHQQAHGELVSVVSHPQLGIDFALSTDQQTLVTQDRQGDVFLWDLSEGRGRARLAGPRHSGVKLASSGRYLLCRRRADQAAGRKALAIFDTTTDRHLAHVESHGKEQVIHSWELLEPSDLVLIWAGPRTAQADDRSPRSLQVWCLAPDPSRPRWLYDIDRAQDADLAEDGRTLAVAEPDRVTLRDSETGAITLALPGLRASSVRLLGPLSDGRLLLGAQVGREFVVTHSSGPPGRLLGPGDRIGADCHPETPRSRVPRPFRRDQRGGAPRPGDRKPSHPARSGRAS